MAAHKKTPIFIRIISNDERVVCINPLELSTFQVVSNARVQLKGDKRNPKEEDFGNADTIRFYFPSGTGLSYSVGVDITKDEFNYICATLLEFMYLNEQEFKAKSEAIVKERMTEWVKISKNNEDSLQEAPVATETK